MSNLVTRAISGSIYVALIITCIFFIGNGVWYLATLLAVPALIEWQGFKEEAHTSRTVLFSIIALLALLGSMHPVAGPIWSKGLLLAALISLLISFLISVFNGDESSTGMERLFHNSFGLAYISLPFMSLISLGEYSPWVIAGIFIMIWSFDSFAYLVGKYLGRHKMMPRISPKKTWEGFAGGLIFAALAAALIWKFAGATELSLSQWLMLSLIVVAAATFGDLFESALKRQHGLKDSGKMMPGHGGILDRIDSLLFAMPISLLFLNLIASITV